MFSRRISSVWNTIAQHSCYKICVFGESVMAYDVKTQANNNNARDSVKPLSENILDKKNTQILFTFLRNVKQARTDRVSQSGCNTVAFDEI